jgi:glutamine amidotransferase
MPIEASATAPFTDGNWLLSHNGVVNVAKLTTCAGAESICDSAILAATIFDRGVQSLGEVIAAVGAADPQARLNIIAANGSRMLATTWGDTLSMLHGADGVVLASEPYDDDPRWVDIPDRHLVDVHDGEVRVSALEGS